MIGRSFQVLRADESFSGWWDLPHASSFVCSPDEMNAGLHSLELGIKGSRTYISMKNGNRSRLSSQKMLLARLSERLFIALFKSWPVRATMSQSSFLHLQYPFISWNSRFINPKRIKKYDWIYPFHWVNFCYCISILGIQQGVNYKNTNTRKLGIPNLLLFSTPL